MAKKFVKMTKPGEDPIDVSLLVVEDHKRLGWTVVGPDGQPAAEAAPEAAAESSTRRGRTRTRKGKAGKAESVPAASDEE